MVKVTLTTLSLLAATSVTAMEAPLKVDKPALQVDANVLLSDSTATGAEKKKTINVNGVVAYQRRDGLWGQAYKVEALNTRNKNASDSNIERYLASAKAMRYLTGAEHYVFVKLQGEKDLSSAYDYTLAPTVGYGRTLLNDKVQSLVAEAGVGGLYARNKVTNDSDFEALATLNAEYRRKINDTMKFEQDVSFEFSESLRTLRTRTALNAQLSEKVSAQVSYAMKKADSDQIDTRDNTTSFGIRYKY